MDQSASAVVCLMSPPANGRRVFTYMCTTCLSDAIIIYLNYSFSPTQQLPICEPPSHSSMVQEADGGSGPSLAEADHRSTVQVTGCLHDLAFFLQWLPGDTGDMCPPMWTVVSGHDNMIHNVHHSMATPHHRLTIFSRTITVHVTRVHI